MIVEWVDGVPCYTKEQKILELQAITACDQSDGYLKKWAVEQLNKLREMK